MTSATGGYVLDTERPRLAHDQRRQALERAARRSAPTTASRSRSGRRPSRLPDAAPATRPTTASPTSCAPPTAAGTGARSGSPAARFPGTEGVISPTRDPRLRADLHPGRGQRHRPQPVHHRRAAATRARPRRSASPTDDEARLRAATRPDHRPRRAQRRAGRRADRRLRPHARLDALERAGRDRRRQRRPLHGDASASAGRAEFVARWAGDSGRQGAGSTVLKVTVRR